MGGTKDHSAVARGGTRVRVRIQTPFKRPIPGVAIEIVGIRMLITDKDGIAEVNIPDADVDAHSGSIRLHIRKLHHGPDPGVGKPVVPGGLFLGANLAKGSGFASGTPGVETDAKGEILVGVLVDAIRNRADEHAAVPVRDLSPTQADEALTFHHWNGHMVVTIGGADLDIEHAEDKDATGAITNFFAPCDARCKVRRRANQPLVGIRDETAFGVKYLYVNSTPRVGGAPGMDFAESGFTALDPRNAVGVCRLAKAMKDADGGIVGIYHIGINGSDSRGDCHGFGRAIDFAGVTKKLPEKRNKVDGGFFRVPLSPGDDFFVFWHWGQVQPWDPAKTAASDDRTTWSRVPLATLDGKSFPRLHYRLLDPLPAGASAFAASIFRRVHRFAVEQYQDRWESRQEEEMQRKRRDDLAEAARKARVKADELRAAKEGEAQQRIAAAEANLKKARDDGRSPAEIASLEAQLTKLRVDAPAQARRESQPAADAAAAKEREAQAQAKFVADRSRPSEIGETPTFTLHPDVPSASSTGCKDKAGNAVPCKDGREAHQNHFHFQIGATHHRTPFDD